MDHFAFGWDQLQYVLYQRNGAGNAKDTFTKIYKILSLIQINQTLVKPLLIAHTILKNK